MFSNISILAFLLLLQSCDYRTGRPGQQDLSPITFNLIIQSDSVLIWNGNQTSFSGFELLVQSSVDSIGKLEYNNDQIVVSIYANNETDLGIIADLQLMLRNSGIRKVNYHSRI
jgi:hypothetical protein